jgi:hypothetical protein
MQDSTFNENKWRIYQLIDYSFITLCMGIEVKQPQIEFDSDMLIVKIGTKNHPLNIDKYCNDPW